ncbi:MAG: efflux RND transporter periplasmic adaptor subunit [Xanthobacteraceae bacterium]|uniref:efflux RND transporter periplasmic adaptor subunit n=1 Tax=Pseudolabrys sp. TaxID=1960880 RepID=UPI003D0A1D49
MRDLRTSGLTGRLTMAVPAILSLAALSLAGCGESNTYVAPPPPKVTVAAPAKQPVTHYLEATGSTAAVNSADLVARVSGFVEKVPAKDGEEARKGDVLFVIEPQPYKLKVEQSQASVVSAQATLKKSESDYQRQVELSQSGSASKSTLENSLATRDSARSTLDQSQASLKLAQNDLSYTSVAAPFDGLVTARKVSIGSYVNSSGTPTVLASVVQTDPIYVNFSISERDVIAVRAMVRERGLTPEQLRQVPVEVGLQTDTGYPIKGRLDYAAPTVDSSTGTLTARGIFDNPQRVMLPGMFVHVRVPLGPAQEALLVPETALGTDQAGRYLLVIGKDNVVEQRPVEIGARQGDLRVITKGVSAEDRVIVAGLQRAVPGQKVDPQTQAAATAPGAK